MASPRARAARVLWALEHALSRPNVPLDVKRALRDACAAHVGAGCDDAPIIVRAFDVVAAAHDAMTRGDGVMRGHSARACADALEALAQRADAPKRLKTRGKDVVDALRAEWCFAAARATKKDGKTDAVDGWKAMEEFWTRWRTLTGEGGAFGDGRGLGMKAKRTYEEVERAARETRWPEDWATRVPSPDDVVEDLYALFNDLCESGALVSFLRVVGDDISSGRYEVARTRDGRVARSSRAGDDVDRKRSAKRRRTAGQARGRGDETQTRIKV